MNDRVVLTLEVAYPMLDLLAETRVWLLADVPAKSEEYQPGEKVAITIQCSGEECRFSGVRHVPAKGRMWLRGEIFRTPMPDKLLVAPEPFPLPVGSPERAEAIAFEKGVTKLVRCTYLPEEDGSLTLVSWEFMGSEERPPLTWK